MEFTDVIDLDAPPERVRAAALDLEAFGRWMPGLVRIERLDGEGPGPLRIGSRWRETRKMYGREASEVFEVRALADDHWALSVDGRQGTTGKGEFHFEYRLAPEGHGTRLTLHARIDMGSGLFVRLMLKLMGGTFRKAVAKDHACLKAFVEASR